ncbi:hypothetical protein TIFTF001_052309 [Ficus carica]|uniref:Uncharacterized protein n=1 Tax=Ficus carica TaxID=3494 RepID=A0AA88ELS4_FICCA|nr:hypothetical protein TIFTF001_052309 [Ficus carica]
MLESRHQGEIVMHGEREIRSQEKKPFLSQEKKARRACDPRSLDLSEIATVSAFFNRTATSHHRRRYYRHQHNASLINEERERNQWREKGKRK